MPHLVRDWMSSPVIVVAPEMSVSYAMTLMRRRNIHACWWRFSTTKA